MENTVKFFLGANSDCGFMSYFKQLQEPDSLQLLILKGGPGSGKSSLMKKVASMAADKGHVVHLIPCASDMDSLDGFIDKTASFAMIDGTAPHTEDPSLPGVRHHIMYTGDLWDTAKLKNKAEEIEFFSDITAEYHSGAASYIKAAGALLRANYIHSLKFVSSAAEDLPWEIMKELPDGDAFREEKRLLSAVTGGKIGFLEETLPALAQKIYVIEDEFGGACGKIIDTVKSIARLKKMHMITCPCSIMPDRTDHIIFPEAGVAFTKGNEFLKSSVGEKTDVSVLYEKGLDKESCQRRCRDAKKLLTKASAFVKAAKKSHDSLEKYYISAMNFKEMDVLFDKIKTMFY